MTLLLDDHENVTNDIKASLEKSRFRFYMSTSFDEFKKLKDVLPNDTIFNYAKYGYEGALYWVKINKSTTIGCVTATLTPEDYMVESVLDPEIEDTVVCAMIVDYNLNDKKRLNCVNTKWEVDNTVDNLADLKTFLNSTTCHVIESVTTDAEREFLKRYNIKLKQFVQKDGENFDTEAYEKYVNRGVTHYEIYGINKETGNLNLYITEWFDKSSLGYIEDNLDKFIKICNFTIRK